MPDYRKTFAFMSWLDEDGIGWDIPVLAAALLKRGETDYEWWKAFLTGLKASEVNHELMITG